ncbi:hypothetical protein ABZ684_06705 [Streptomyces sp. NPDC006995]|uniref:hypothetical protein n=1 Tax=Streptomyces sp. NPDC006995 TaxID=3156907 RepID=UPI0033F1C610
MEEQDIKAVVLAAKRLDIVRCGPESGLKRWAHLSLCVLDAVFSINAHYSGVVNVCRRYADHMRLEQRLYPRGTEHPGGEEPLSRFVECAADMPALTAVLDNCGRTSPRGGILKAEAAVDYARILVGHGVDLLIDVDALLADDNRLARVEKALAQVPGHGAHGVRLSYLWMLAGDDTGIKPDRMVLNWLAHVLKRPMGVSEGRTLLTAAAQIIGCTPWELDHAIWLYQRSTGK